MKTILSHTFLADASVGVFYSVRQPPLVPDMFLSLDVEVNKDWHATITPEGAAQGDKAQIWKAGYHNGRAMIECLALLKQMPQ
jgi:hypothetical protein